MSAPNHTGLFLEELHHTLRGMLDGLAEMHVSPVSMLQCTLMASSALPWFGSTQYSPTQDMNIGGKLLSYSSIYCCNRNSANGLRFDMFLADPLLEIIPPHFIMFFQKQGLNKSLLWDCQFFASTVLTALLHRVAPLQVITGPGRVFLAAVGALHAVDLAAQGLQSGLNSRIDRYNGAGVAVGQGFVFTELRWRRWPGVIILWASKQVIHSRYRRSRGTGRARRPRFTRRAL